MKMKIKNHSVFNKILCENTFSYVTAIKPPLKLKISSLPCTNVIDGKKHCTFFQMSTKKKYLLQMCDT